MLNSLINDLQSKEYKMLLVSTTARESMKISRLPDKRFADISVANVLVTDPFIAKELFQKIDGQVTTLLIDVERKKDINLMEVAKNVVRTSKILPYKPNDVTLEATDQLILNQLGTDLTNKEILIYGTGNIAFKLALRILEREANVSVIGRNENKTQALVDILNLVKPRHSTAKASVHQEEMSTEYDGLISFLSSEKVIGASMVRHIKRYGFAIDGGIGNFQGLFIASALEKEVSCLRLDVRLGNPFLLAGITSLDSENEFFCKVMGSREIADIKLVAGGVIGDIGSVIVDQIKSPRQIIGIANGYGGLKNEEQFTNDDRKNLQYAKETIVQTV